MSWNIELYKNENGQSPVEEFIATVSPKFRAKALWEIELLSSFGTRLKEPYSKPLKGEEYKNLLELRIRFASDISRIFYFLPIGSTIVLLHGFVKKTDKTPLCELQTARRHMQRWSLNTR